jgi:UDP-glucose 4-epimerase
MNILVAGGAGFIGSHIVDRYIKEGHKVIIADNLFTGYKRNVNPKAKFYKIDIRSKRIEDIFKKYKIDIINHHAAQAYITRSFADPLTDAKINIEGSLNLLQFAVKYKVQKVIFASTGGAIYGEQEYFPADENHSNNPLSPYGIAKLTVEKYLNIFHNHYGLNYVCLRYSNAYGPRQITKTDAGVIALFSSKISKGQQPYINGTGKNTRDYIFINDIVEANVKALKCNKSISINIATGKEISLNTLFKIINDYYGNKIKEKHRKGIKGEQKRSVLDIKLAKKVLNWTPKFDIKEGIILTCKSFEKK